MLIRRKADAVALSVSVRVRGQKAPILFPAEEDGICCLLSWRCSTMVACCVFRYPMGVSLTAYKRARGAGN